MENDLKQMNEHVRELLGFKKSLQSPSKVIKFINVTKKWEETIKEAIDELFDIRCDMEEDWEFVSDEAYEIYTERIQKVESMLKELISIE